MNGTFFVVCLLISLISAILLWWLYRTTTWLKGKWKIGLREKFWQKNTCILILFFSGWESVSWRYIWHHSKDRRDSPSEKRECQSENVLHCSARTKYTYTHSGIIYHTYCVPGWTQRLIHGTGGTSLINQRIGKLSRADRLFQHLFLHYF